MNKWFSTTLVFSSVQWMFFIFANTVMIPISVANAFDLPSETMAMMLRTSLIFTGLASVFQAWKGHRLPLIEGHSGLLWGLILNLGMSATSLGMSYSTIGGGIATGVLLACLVTVILAMFNAIPLLKSIFNPMVMSVYLLLLTFQLVLIFSKGMLKISNQGTIDIPVSLYSVGLVIFVILLKIKGNKLVSNYSILIGLVVGWFFYDLLFLNSVPKAVSSQNAAFTLFPLGKPNLELGIVAVAFLAGIMNLSNTFSAISAGEKVLKRKTSNKEYRHSIIITVLYTIVGTGFGLVSYSPFASSIGFLQSTRILDRKPFYFGGALLAILGIVPALGSFLVTMPVTVGNAVLFVAYLQLFGTAFSSLNGQMFNSNTIFRLAIPVLVGFCLMNISPSLFRDLPVLIQPFISNGLIMGVILSIVLEKAVNWTLLEQIEVKNS